MRILILDGYPSSESFCAALADRYEAGARSAGHEIRRVVLRDAKWTPIPRGEDIKRTHDQDFIERQSELLRWCEHLVIVVPNWWWGLPALARAWVERVLTGWGAEYFDRYPWVRGTLRGRSARVIYTQNASRLVAIGRLELFWLHLRIAILRHCGFGPNRRTCLSNFEHASEPQRADWLDEAHALGAAGR